jgi:predicted cupin superfamily sugar epimerase
MKAFDWIRHLDLLPHPEGGYYKETYRSSINVDGNILSPHMVGVRQLATAIYFLLEENNFSAFHRIRSDETWHFYSGDPLEVIELLDSGEVRKTVVGSNPDRAQFVQYTVKAGTWFGSRVLQGGNFSLVGCTVYPGFDFIDFEMGTRSGLMQRFPHQKEIIEQLTRI